MRFTQPLIDPHSYKSRRIDQKRVPYLLYNLCFVSLCPERVCAYYTLFMSKHATPSDSNNPELFFLTRMTVTNPDESSQPVTLIEQESEEVLEVHHEIKEVLSMPRKEK